MRTVTQSLAHALTLPAYLPTHLLTKARCATWRRSMRSPAPSPPWAGSRCSSTPRRATRASRCRRAWRARCGASACTTRSQRRSARYTPLATPLPQAWAALPSLPPWKSSVFVLPEIGQWSAGHVPCCSAPAPSAAWCEKPQRYTHGGWAWGGLWFFPLGRLGRLLNWDTGAGAGGGRAGKWTQ